ncbi:MAG TPA: sulfotransferase [Nocardioides sp.]|uniref:sulfotransferase family protein n=1 Tax=Nocardioides sp. TaxID=35761 RepID=UPI002C1CEE8F|nr:sulfotransferase [Nocardioides sp.]HTW15421.1 sulfotransferase [Nocardioides sp.]
MTDWTLSGVLDEARRKEGLEDWGPGPFEEPLAVLLGSYAAAGLTDVGAHLLRGGAVRSLRMRLRAQEWVRRHPEILEEEIADPVVVVGMMRSGTTLVQRLLAADPRLQCAYGWEVVSPVPRLDQVWAGEDPRIARAEEQAAVSRELAPDLFAIHPMHPREAEEEIVFLADAFLSHVPESSAEVPAYRSWIDTQDFTPAYDHLHRMLQLLQWQKRRRGEQVRRWVLKTPAHLGYLDVLLARFPGAHVVHLHRDPRATIGSGASLNATMRAMHHPAVDLHRVGAEWLERMGWAHDRARAVRARWGVGGPVTDLEYDAVVADPVAAIAPVYDDLGLPLAADAEAAMRRWLADRPHDASRRPDYRLETYGLTGEQVDERFAGLTPVPDGPARAPRR